MEYQKTKRDIEQEKSDDHNNPVVIYLKNRENLQFNVGDILIRQWKTAEGGWRTETHTSDAPKKYLYAFENSVGIGYLRGYNADGRLSEVPVCITEFMETRQRLLLDPDYADHIMIGEGEFDPLELQKEKKRFRTRMMNKNRKMLVPFETPAAILAWVKTLKVGDTFYHGYSISDMVTKKYEVVAVDTNTSVKDVQPAYNQDSVKRIFDLKSTDSYPIITIKTLKHPYQQTGHIEKCGGSNFNRGCVTMQEPYRLTDKI